MNDNESQSTLKRFEFWQGWILFYLFIYIFCSAKKKKKKKKRNITNGLGSPFVLL